MAKAKKLLTLAVACLLIGVQAIAQNIFTIAGTGVAGYSGDGSAATTATINLPSGIARDTAGNIFIADGANNVIRKLKPNGIITTFATLQSAPRHLALDAAGNLYVTLPNAARLVKVNSAGAVTTIAGTGVSGNAGDGLLAVNADIAPEGLAVDAANNIYFTDTVHGVIRKIDNAGYISTIAGTGVKGYDGDNASAIAAKLFEPEDLAIDAAGNIYVTDPKMQRVRKINSAGIITTIAGSPDTTNAGGFSGDGGAATTAQFNLPSGIAIDAAGNIYLADAGNQRIRKIDLSGIVNTIAGVGIAGYNGENISPLNSRLNDAANLEVDAAGNIYLSERAGARIRMIYNQSAISVNITASQTSVCSSATINFTATSNGSSTSAFQWKVNGNNVGSNSSQYTSNTLSPGDVVTCTASTTYYNIPSLAVSNAITMAAGVVPTINIVASQNPIISGTLVSFTAVSGNGGGAPTYQWKVNGNNVGINSASYSYSPANNDLIRCVLTSNAVCANPTTVTSDSLVISVLPPNVPSVNIIASRNNICSGTSVTFTAVATNGGTAPTYLWLVNGAQVGSNSNQYISTSLTNGDVVGCIMTSDAVNLSSPTAVSNAITMNVSSNVVPSITIMPSQNPVNLGAQVILVASSVNGGLMPVYKWKVNGVNMPGNGVTYSYVPGNGDSVSCTLISNAACASPDTARSNKVTLSVIPQLTPATSIVATQNTICAGTAVTFTATAVNGGATPTYQWKVNGNNVGTNSNQYTSTTLANGDVVTCVMTSNYANLTTPTAASNAIPITVNPVTTPSVSIFTTQNPVNSGSQVTLVATPVNGGIQPTYQWQVNGVNVSGSNVTYTYVPANNDVVTCVMTSSQVCPNPATATSNTVTMLVAAPLTPTINIIPSKVNICAGELVSFNAVSTNAGTPAYHWQVNGINVGSNSSQYSNSTLANGDIVTCVLTAYYPNNTTRTAFSNTITMSVNPLVTPFVSITPAQNPVNPGAVASFTAAAVNGGSTPVYHWKVNGVSVSGSGMSYNYVPANGDVVKCVLTSNAACVSPDTALSNAITVSVLSQIMPSVSVVAAQNNICSGTPVVFTANPVNGGTAPIFQWKVNGANVGTNSNQYTSSTLTNGDAVTCVMTSNYPYATVPTVTSNSVTMKVNPVVTPSINISASQNPVLPGTSIILTAAAANGGNAPAYQWSVNGVNVGTNSSYYIYAPSNNDVVNCTLTSSAACANPATAVSNGITMIVGVTTGINPIAVDESLFESYPNPNDGCFTVKGKVADKSLHTVSLEVFDALGQSVYKQELSVIGGKYEQRIALPASLSAGNYFLKVNDGNSKTTRFLVTGR